MIGTAQPTPPPATPGPEQGRHRATKTTPPGHRVARLVALHHPKAGAR